MVEIKPYTGYNHRSFCLQLLLNGKYTDWSVYQTSGRFGDPFNSFCPYADAIESGKQLIESGFTESFRLENNNYIWYTYEDGTLNPPVEE